MPTISTPVATTQSYIPVVSQVQLGRYAGLHLHFSTLSALNTAVTTERTNITNSLGIWTDGQPFTIATESATGTHRTWNISAQDARTVHLSAGKAVVLAADSNAVIASAGVPNSGTGNDGDLAIDTTAGTYYVKSAGTWGVGVLISGASNLANISDMSADARSINAAANYTAIRALLNGFSASSSKTRSLLEFVGTYNPNGDHTDAIRTAQLAAAEDEFDLEVPPLVFNYSDMIPGCTRSIRGVGKGASVFVHQGTNGTNARWSYTGSNIEVSGLSFRVANTPAAATNDATELDGVLNFNTVLGLTARDLDFDNCYGTAVIVRHVEDFDLLRLTGRNLRKDGFHITGASKNGRRTYCRIFSGGDDAFPIVGYLTGTGAGQPDNIVDAYNMIRGVKFARGFAYVGARNIRNYGCVADGLMAPGFATQAPTNEYYRLLSGLYIASEAAYGTYGNENIKVKGMQVKNCGYTSDFSGAVLNAVHIVGRSGQTTKSLQLDLQVENVGTKGIFVNGGVAAGVENLQITGSIKATHDPNGWFGTANAGTASGIELQNSKDMSLDLDIDTTGAYGVQVTSSCTGKLDLKLKSSDINASGGGGGGVDIVIVGASSGLTDISLEVDVIKQTTVNVSGTPYFLDRLIECNNAGKVRKLRVNDYASLNKKVVTGVADQPITVTASPFTWTNTNPIPVNARVIGGTVTSIARGQTTGVVSPQYATIPGKTQGYCFVQPGESVVVTYTVAPTMDYAPSTF